MHSEDQERVFQSFFEALEGPATCWNAEYRLERAGGEWSHVHDRAVISRDSSGKVTRVVGAMLDVTDLKRAEEALQGANQRLHNLSRDLLRAQDYERRRIARELHDSTAQLLTALSINLSRLQEPGLEPERQRQALSEASELAAACSAEIRTVTCLLHPPVLDEVGLASALQSYAQGFSQRTGIQVEIKVSADFGRLNNDLEATLFRIVQEGLANVHKHSGSHLAVVRLERDPHEVRLVLQDRGRGFPKALANQNSGFVRFGIGIVGMRERAEQFGGRLELTSNHTGARVTVTMPLVQSYEENASVVGG
jgi:signal transduction histidine kinase